jgi:hypothetical protein
MKEIIYKGNIYQLDIDYWKGELLNDNIEFVVNLGVFTDSDIANIFVVNPFER